MAFATLRLTFTPASLTGESPAHDPATMTNRARVLIAIVCLTAPLLVGIGSLRAHARPDRGAGATASGDSIPQAASAQPAAGRLWIQMRNVDLHIDETHALGITELRGEVIRTHPDVPAALDDTKSFTVRVTDGTVSLSGDALAALLNEFVFAYHGAPLRNLRARTSGSEVVLSGLMRKGVELPFEITSTLALEPDGRVRLHPTKTRILGIDGAALMRALGLHLDKLLDLRGAKGISVAANDMLLEPTRILPPPAIEGRLTSIRVEGAKIVQTFSRLPDDSVFARYARPDTAATNFIYFRGGQLRFGKLLMSDTDLDIIDADEHDPFDLDLDQYARQLVAGTSRTMPDKGLRVIMPDYRRVAKH
jgi:hypothetical protein